MSDQQEEHPALAGFRKKTKSMSLAQLRHLVRAYTGAVDFTENPVLKQLFSDLAAIGKEELDRNEWSA